MDFEDWDLQAVVKSCCCSEPVLTTATTTVMRDPFSSFPISSVLKEYCPKEDEDLLTSFPDLLATKTALHELEELCKPFFLKPQRPPQKQLQQEKKRTPSSSSSLPVAPKQPSRSKRRYNPSLSLSLVLETL